MEAKKSNIIALVICILIPQAAGGIGALFTEASVSTWYQGLAKPSFNPPGWIFGPVWTALYIMMGVALFLVWRKGPGRREVKTAAFLFAAQLALNVLWSFLFFYLRMPMAAFIEIIVLWIMIVATAIALYRESRAAGALFIPYILWVGFASVLNFLLWRLNS
jgi:translocator protein